MILTLILSAFGCVSNPNEADGDVYDSFTVDAGYGGSDDFFAAALNSDLLESTDKEHLPIFKFETLEEYNKFISDHAEILKTENLPSYFDEAYFSEQTVLLIYKSANSGSYVYGVKKHDLGKTDICIYIEQKNDPENIDTAMAGWFIGLCLDKNITEGVTGFDAVYED